MTEVEKLLAFINSPPDQGWSKKDLQEALRLLKRLCNSKKDIEISCEGRTRCTYCFKPIKKEAFYKFPCKCFHVFHANCLKTMIFNETLNNNENSIQIECKGCQRILTSENLNEILGKQEFEKLKDNINGHIFKCDICMEKKKVEESCITLSCEHRVCADCLKNAIETDINDSKWPITCPMLKCKVEIDYYIIKSLVSELHFMKYDATSLQKISSLLDKGGQEMAIKCPNADCKLIFFIDQKEHYTHHTCERCHLKFCVNGCPRPHEGFTCENFRQWLIENDEGDKRFDVLMKKEGWVKCPKCGIAVERIKDCPHMKCGLCKTEFCYACKDKGMVWGTCQHSK